MSKEYSDLEIEDSEDEDNLVIEETSSSFSSEIRSAETNIFEGEKFKIFQKSKSTKTPIEFVFTINGEIISSIEKISEMDKNILDSYQYFFSNNIKISPKNFLMIFYMANKNKTKEYLIENFNYFQKLTNLDTFYEDNFKDYVKKFKNSYTFLMDKSLEEFKRFEEFFRKIQDLKYSQSSENIIDTFQEYTIEIEINIKDGDYNFNLENSDIIFNNFQVSKDFEFIMMKTNINKYKIFRQSNNLEEYVSNLDDYNLEPNTILIFYNIEINNVYHRNNIIIDLNTEKMSIKYPADGLSIIKEKISIFYPNIKFLEEEEKNLVGDFQLEFKNYDETKIYYLTLNDPIFSEFIYVREDAAPRSLKENLKFYYVGSEEKREKLNYSLYFYINKLQGDKYIINFNSKKHSPTILREFIDIMNKLIFHYNSIDYENEINYFLITTPYLGNNSNGGLGGKEEERIIRSKQISKKKIDLLYTKNKRLFSKNVYAKSCSCQKQPVIISEEDVEDWKKYKFNGKTRNVVLYPPEKSKHKVQKDYYVCTDDEFTNLNLRRNPDVSSEYPLIPCCNKSYFPQDLYDDYDLIKKKPISYWSKKEDYKGKGKNILKTLKTLSRGRLGRIHEYLESLLKSVQKRDYIREGISKNSPSSLFEIIFYINKDLNDSSTLYKRYFDAIKEGDFKLKNTIVSFFRKEAINKDYYMYYLCNQELYDFSNEEFIDLFTKSDKEFNSKYLYKFLEISLNLNVFIFEYDKITDNIDIEIPNCDRFHIREIREELPCIIILKHKKTPFNIYELVRLGENNLFEETNSKYIFPKSFTKFMKNYIENKSYNTVEIFPNIDLKNLLLSKPLVRKNPYSNINWNKILINYKIIGQYLNYSGRITKLDIQYDKNPKKKMSIFTPPSFPVYAPGEELDIYIPPMKDIIKIFGKDYEKGENGLWYQINDIKHGIFIPCKEKNVNGKVCENFVVVQNLIIKNRIENNIKITKRNSVIFLQVMIWLYLLERMDFKTWSKKYFYKDKKFNKEIFRTSKINIPYRFPKSISNTTNGIEYLSNYIPFIFQNNKIILYPELYDSITSFMENNYLKNNYGVIQDIKNNTVINNIFRTEEDYDVQKFTTLIVGEENYKIWKNNSIKKIFDNTINEEFIFKQESFSWKDPNSKIIYLVQNNKENSKICSFFCSLFWEEFNRIMFNYNVTIKNIWGILKNFNQKVLKQLLDIDFKFLKKFIKEETGKDIYFSDINDCFDYLLKNNIPYKLNHDYSYIVFSKIDDDIVITEKNIINEQGFVHQFYRYEDGGYTALLPI